MEPMLVLKSRPDQWFEITHAGETMRVKLNIKTGSLGTSYRLIFDVPESFSVGRVK